ncbi:MAG: choice-of-anchor tandem repeat GloVer-containing protein [Terriglobales bacterium]|jgi:uncharacterized repeat protein (TIGR03803 family)
MQAKTLAFLAMILLSAASASAVTETLAVTETTINTFSGTNGLFPTSGLIFDASGNAYGTTENGGDNFYGSIYQLTPIRGGGYSQSVLYSFTNGADGAYPSGPLAMDGSGNLYGTATGAGSTACNNGCGTVFKITPSKSGSFQVIYSFTGGTDGSNPAFGGLVFDKSGNLFGTTELSGSTGAGTVFELSPGRGSWTETTLHGFQGGNDAGYPLMGLTIDPAGNLYGAAVRGQNGVGAVYWLKKTSSGYEESVLYSFQGGNDGAYPEYGALIIKGKTIYGTTAGGGASNQGVVYSLALSNGKIVETPLYSFTGGNDGGQPFAGVVADSANYLYGATAYFGQYGDGVVFVLSQKNGSWHESVIHAFVGSDGKYPLGTPVINGNALYGTTQVGGSSNGGVVWQVTAK